ncbi:hypothetical protein EDD17DRAFT_1751158 [Pisolithus thermaeus]|nr:hypothetical protein EDD17DRAFT_1751158 [Pisolithus thermaeus]
MSSLYETLTPQATKPTPRFYLPPTSGAQPNSPYHLGDHSATTTVPAIPNINDPPWQFSYNTAHPMSFMDLLKSSLNVDLESGHLPQPTTNFPTLPTQSLLVLTGATTISRDQAAVPITPCKGGINPQEMMSVSLPMEGHHEAAVAVGGTFANPAQDVPAPDHLSVLSTTAQNLNTAAMGGT